MVGSPALTAGTADAGDDSFSKTRDSIFKCNHEFGVTLGVPAAFMAKFTV